MAPTLHVKGCISPRGPKPRSSKINSHKCRNTAYCFVQYFRTQHPSIHIVFNLLDLYSYDTVPKILNCQWLISHMCPHIPIVHTLEAGSNHRTAGISLYRDSLFIDDADTLTHREVQNTKTVYSKFRSKFEYILYNECYK